ncbi:FAD-dependent monooxygenase [Bacillus sp. Marseille-P3661]|uniref:FAD-dependent monooxygenase n=1 Tax=Bacillus sp. Marseille-P3661 TaxID=1936234 RepID=UPI000C85F153|nr:FAD-dependent monooxygenase [Bacillus sp. Marseille-P3661]
MKYKTNVCIVGGGPAGAFLGYLLAKNGISTIIIERASRNDREFRGEHINSETEDLLKEHGLYEKVEEHGLLKMEKLEYFVGNEIVKTIKPTFPDDHVGIHVPQPHLLNVLIEESERYNNYQHIFNAAVINLIQDVEGRYTGIKAKKDGEEFVITCSIIVGADGRYSTVRKLAEIPVVQKSHGYDVLWAKIPAPSNWEPTTRMLLVNGHQLALFTQTGGYIQIGWNIEEGSFPSLRKTALLEFLTPLLELCPHLRKIVLQHLHTWEDFVLLKVHSSLSETWVKDGLVLIGDAAHTMTPTAAIGINCALKDAYVLTPIITAAIRENDLRAERLKLFEEQRRAEIERLQQLQLEKETLFSENFVLSN